ncbi:hypothetical protein A4D02_23340 [Niastella koreensis]|uniref:RiboL-PSP-HEPN domain-containing protein n=2 Tax=Niastella koreensis TaxID=354356 RepID=G8T9S4_NIAKG|nr:HEPN domain-containing protein [Niastella koreensis]AEW00267.1 hypothetical protein Niako_3984 [Niastella koreensis GR20-10]OQP52138.1 hypothetical protein A4D02_23340 [Niastella koreensis]
MVGAFNQFNQNMRYVKELDALYGYLSTTLKLPNDLSDLLRAQWVMSVSALDKLIHEFIRIGMVEAFEGQRPRTRKYQSFGISTSTMTNIISSAGSSSSVYPPSYWFEQEIVQRHQHLAFQDPDKIADGLSLIWDESHKWQYLAGPMGMSQQDLVTTIKTIATRRNKIVHEADFNILTGLRNQIDKIDTDTVVPFIIRLGEEIYNAIR